jgi:hypothetical protein
MKTNGVLIVRPCVPAAATRRKKAGIRLIPLMVIFCSSRIGVGELDKERVQSKEFV